MRALTIAAVLLASAGALAQDEPESSASLDVSVEESAVSRGMVTAQRDGLSRRELSLEASLRVAALEFDAVSFIGAQRTLLMGVFETYCAVEFLIPPEEGFRALDFVLGIGCLIGASTLYVMGIRRLLYPKAGTEAHERLVQFYTDRRAGSIDLDAYEDALFEAARHDRRRRWVRFSLGVLELAGAATVAGLTGRDKIDTTAGVSIAVGTTIIAILGLVNAGLRSPAERAAEQHRAAREVQMGW